MKKFISIALGLAVTSAAFGTFGAVNDQLRGSDTLESFTRIALEECPAAAPLVYIGGGSSNGEQAMLDGSTTDQLLIPTQEVSSMSRFLDPARTCRAQDPRESQGLLVALDGLAIVSDAGNTQCGSSGVAFTGCIDVANLNGTGGIQCPDCEPSGTQYCFQNEFDALRVLFSGMHKNAGNSIANQQCNSDVRHSLANSWDALHEGTCTTGACTQVSHAWRRDDLSGTTDTFLGLLNLPAVATKPFCNGLSTEENDPVRRPCPLADDVCQANGTAGLVLPIFVPELAPEFEGNAYALAGNCQGGRFGLADAQQTSLGGGAVRYDCPERGNFSIAGFCLAPQTATGQFNCLSPRSNPNVFFANLTDDARLFNRWTRTASGALAKDKAGRPETFGWHKIRSESASECRENSATLAIGCLADQYGCSVGFAGREASDTFPGTKALAVKGVLPTDQAVRKLLESPVPADVYPLARGLFFNSLVGFDNVTNAKEAALSSCMDTQAIADNAAASSGFITLGIPPRCEDFNETACNTRNFTCDFNADCGGVGVCVGGNPATTAKDGTCQQTCTVSADCTQGRTCNVDGRCVFAANTNSCL